MINKSLFEFADKFNYEINQGAAYEKLLKYRGEFFMILCPCQLVTDDNLREAKLCPCEEVHDSIKRTGSCDCGIFLEK